MLKSHKDVVLGLSAHPSERIIASGGLDGVLKIWFDDEHESTLEAS